MRKVEEISGMELRRAVLEALGWRLMPLLDVFYAHVPGCEEQRPAAKGCHGRGCRTYGPAIESSAEVSEREFRRFCVDRKYHWLMQSLGKEALIPDGILLDLFDEYGEIVAGNVIGKDESEARARAILSALKGER